MKLLSDGIGLNWNETGCVELNRIDLNSIELNWIQYNWNGIAFDRTWIELHCTGLYWLKLNWLGLNWTELRRIELSWADMIRKENSIALNWDWLELNSIELASNWMALNRMDVNSIGNEPNWIGVELWIHLMWIDFECTELVDLDWTELNWIGNGLIRMAFNCT